MNFQDLFLKKSKYDKVFDHLPQYYEDPEKGFFVFEDREDALCVLQACGDGKWVDEIATMTARELGHKKIVFETRRNPKAWERKFGYKLTGYVLEKEID